MTVAKRPITIDPDTSLPEATDLLTDIDDKIEVRIGDRVFVLHERPAEPVQPPISRTPIESKGTDEEKVELARSAVGSWADLSDLDELERRIYEQRDREPTRPPVVFE